MGRLFFIKLLFVCLFIQIHLSAQVSIISIAVQPFNLTPNALLNVNIMNGGDDCDARIVTYLFNSNNQPVLTVKSGAFKLKRGLNTGNTGDRPVQGSEFSNSSQANYLKTTHNLASGRYKICSTLSIVNDPETMDDFCEELEADFNQYLYLVNPFDGDTIESKNPILAWTHNEPFSILAQGEFYRMVVTEMKTGQSAEEAIVVNTPAMVKNYIQEHQLQYPVDAKDLKDGSKYAWQVQKLADGVIINKTEAWIFNTRKQNELKSIKYVAMKRELDGSYYHAHDGFVYFKFSEEYKTQGQLSYSLRNDRLESVNVEVKKDTDDMKTFKPIVNAQLKVSGDNLYELNLNTRKNKPGFYTLEVKNEKNESFYLKIFLP